MHAHTKKTFPALAFPHSKNVCQKLVSENEFPFWAWLAAGNNQLNNKNYKAKDANGDKSRLNNRRISLPFSLTLTLTHSLSLSVFVLISASRQAHAMTHAQAPNGDFNSMRRQPTERPRLLGFCFFNSFSCGASIVFYSLSTCPRPCPSIQLTPVIVLPLHFPFNCRNFVYGTQVFYLRCMTPLLPLVLLLLHRGHARLHTCTHRHECTLGLLLSLLPSSPICPHTVCN